MKKLPNPETQTGVDNMNKYKNTKKGERRAVWVSIPVDGLRVSIEFVVAFCHLISFLMIIFSKSLAEDICWTLLTLCITTLSTIIQFQNEGQWKFSGNIFFKFPFWGILGIIVLIVASYIIPELSVITEHKAFAIVVSLIVTIRQIMHAIMIFNIFQNKKKEEVVKCQA